MCDSPTPGTERWKADKFWSPDVEPFPRLLARADLRDYSNMKSEVIANCHQPERIAMAFLSDKPPNLIISRLDSPWADDMHAPVIDLDIPVRLRKSGTQGHYHLYIDRVISWDKYVPILEAFYRADIIQRGWYESSMENKFTAVRYFTVKGDSFDR